MKIGLVRRGYSRTGGAEIYLRRFADAAVDSGHQVMLFAAEWPRTEWPWKLVRTAGSSPARFASAFAAAKPLQHCDYIFSFERIRACDCYRAGDGVHAAWLERRAAFEPMWKPWLRRFNAKHREMLTLEKQLFAASGARCVIANSHLVKREIESHFGYPADRIHVVHNGVPPNSAPPEARAQTRRELALEDDDFAVLFAGSGWERKGLRFAVHAMNVAQLGRATLLVAGRGNPHAMPRSSRVRFLGPVKNMDSLLAASDAFILPTVYEPFSNACLEALAAGLPVITTEANGFTEIITPGIEGEVVARPDDIPALAAAIERWSDAERRALLRLQLAALGPRFSIEENVRQTLAVIERSRVA